jgi:hypothetical protein
MLSLAYHIRLTAPTFGINTQAIKRKKGSDPNLIKALQASQVNSILFTYLPCIGQ